MPRRRPIYLQCAEMLALFACLLTIDHLVLAGNGFQTVEPNPYWLPVLVFSVAYGTGMGLLAGALASAIWITSPHVWPGDSDLLKQQLHLSTLPMLWLTVALVIGEVTARRAARQASLNGRMREMEGKWKRIGEVVSRLSRANRDLQVRIATDQRSLNEAVAATLELCEADPARLTPAVQKLIGLAAQSDDFTLYSASNHRLVARLSGLAASNPPADLSSTPLGEAMLEQPRLLHAGRVSDQAILGDLGVAALPVFGLDKRLRGLLLIHSAIGMRFTDAKAGELSHMINLLVRSRYLLGDPPRYLLDEWIDSRIVA